MALRTLLVPHSAACPTRVLIDQLADKWAILVLLGLAAEPVRFSTWAPAPTSAAARHPLFTAAAHEAACRPFALVGPQVEVARVRLVQRADIAQARDPQPMRLLRIFSRRSP